MARPKQFDPDTALDKAVEVFWEKGYEATSVQDLVDRMGINRFSMYATFGDKHALFQRALDRYADRIIQAAVAMSEGEGIDAIRSFFANTVDRMASGRGGYGCLMANTSVELGPHDDLSAERTRRYFDRVQGVFAESLRHAERKQGFRPRRSIEDLARYLTGTAIALTVLAKGQPGEAALRAYVDTALTVLDDVEP